MDTINIAPLGEIALQKPKMSIVYDIVSTWTAQPSQAHIGRLAAAALGVCAGHALGLSVYDTDQARPIAYGGLIMDELLQRKVRPHDIIDNGMKILTVLAPLLLSEDEVKKK